MVTATFSRVFDTAAELIERRRGLDAPAQALSALVDRVVGRGLVKDLLSGSPFGHPVHPLLVTIPIGTWTGASLLDVAQQPKAAEILTGVGVLGAAAAVVTGLSDWADTAGAEKRVGIVHATANSIAIAIYTASWLARRRGEHVKGALLSAAGFSMVGVGGWLGGHLIYAQGVGIDTTAFQQPQLEWADAIADSEVLTGRLSYADLNGVPVVLTRGADGAVRAYADRCTHRGAPLHEGEIVDNCIVCPWHDSRFSVDDGGVDKGPATRPQPSYEVRVAAGRVQLRRADEVRALRTNPVGV